MTARFRRRVFAALSAAAASAVLSGAPAAGQTLAESLSDAYSTNPDLAAERARLRAAQEGLVQARSQRLPTLNAGGSVTESERWGSQFFNSPPSSIDYQLTATQALYAGGRISGGIDQARAGLEASRAQLRSAGQQVLIDAVAAHMNVIRDQQVVAIRRNNVEVLAEQLRAAEDRFEVGEITRTDVAQAEARLSGARAQLAAAQAGLASSRANYERVVGVAPGELGAPEALPRLPESIGEAAETAVDLNPTLAAARFNEIAAEKQVQIARGALRPEVSLRAQAAENRDADLTGQGQGQASISAQVSVPIFTGGLNGSRVREALAQSDAARLQVTAARRQVLEGVRSAWNNLLAAQAVIESSRQAVRANEIAFDGVEQEAFVGLRTTLDVLNAEQELLNSRLELVRAERDLYVASYGLLQAMGRLDPRWLGLTVDEQALLAAEREAERSNFDLTPWN